MTVDRRPAGAPDPTEAALLAEAWAALAGAPEAPAGLRVGGVGRLPSCLPVLPALTAAVGSATLAAAELWAARGGDGPPGAASVDRRHVSVAGRSERFAHVGDAAPASGFAPLSRFWRTADGWIRLHANYPWHRDRLLTELALPADAALEAVGATVGARGTLELEEALAPAGALGFGVRTPEAWAAHPQGSAVAALPLIERTPGAPDRHVTPRPPGARAPADGLRVLDLTRVIAGPVATRTLAAWGADVLRLDGPRLPELPEGAVDTLPGKRSAELDLETTEGRRTLERLLREADVLVQGYRPGALARFGLEPEELAERHPHLVVVVLSAWGAGGPWAARRGFDSLVQAATGIAHVEGDDGAPGALPAQALDHATGHLAAAAALRGLVERARGAGGGTWRLSLARTARWLSAAGPSVRDDGPADPRDAPDDLLVPLPGAGERVTVVRPPGRLDDVAPAWARTTTLGADPPRFAPRD